MNITHSSRYKTIFSLYGYKSYRSFSIKPVLYTMHNKMHCRCQKYYAMILENKIVLFNRGKNPHFVKYFGICPSALIVEWMIIVKSWQKHRMQHSEKLIYMSATTRVSFSLDFQTSSSNISFNSYNIEIKSLGWLIFSCLLPIIFSPIDMRRYIFLLRYPRRIC